MPFGLDLKSLIIGGAFVYFLLPMLLGMMSRKSSPAAAA